MVGIIAPSCNQRYDIRRTFLLQKIYSKIRTQILLLPHTASQMIMLPPASEPIARDAICSKI